ncbi:MAG: serine hydrolase domain-containing protein [Candidatus Hermodarchaeota archaeon]
MACLVNNFNYVGSLVLISVLFLSLTNVVPGTITLKQDYWPSPDWQSTTPEAQGMNSDQLNQMNEYIAINDYPIDAVVIIRHGYLVFEEYYNTQYDEDRLHTLYSVTKSFISALIGIAIEEGFISSLEQKMVDFFPDRTIDNLDCRKQNINLAHLLTMTSGIRWDEDTYSMNDPRNDVYQMNRAADAVQYVLNLPMVSNPGTQWSYCSGASHVLSAILTLSTGLSTDKFAEEYLFKALGISQYVWYKDPQGIPRGGGGLLLSPRDMAKLGHLYLNNGSWNGQQVVSKDWVLQTTTFVSDAKGWGYSYHWWTIGSDVYAAIGIYGQMLFVVPKHDLVVAFTAQYAEGYTALYFLLTSYIIDSITNIVPSIEPDLGDMLFMGILTLTGLGAILGTLGYIWLKRRRVNISHNHF